MPTFAELKLDDMNWMAFFGLIAPKGTPEPIVQAAQRGAGQGAGDAGRARQARRPSRPSWSAIRRRRSRAEIARELARMRRAVAAAKIELN